MAAAAVGDGFFRCIYEGCISGGDPAIERRPYHKNCGCALHDKSRCHHSRSGYKNVSYPLRRAWSDGSLTLHLSSSSNVSSPSSSPAVAASAEFAGSRCHQLGRSIEDDDDPFLFKV